MISERGTSRHGHLYLYVPDAPGRRRSRTGAAHGDFRRSRLTCATSLSGRLVEPYGLCVAGELYTKGAALGAVIIYVENG